MVVPVDLHLDVSGVCCPIPLIQMGKAMQELKPGQTLQIIGNDPIFETAVKDFCHANGHTLLETRPGDNYSITMLIKVGG